MSVTITNSDDGINGQGADGGPEDDERLSSDAILHNCMPDAPLQSREANCDKQNTPEAGFQAS